jgi:hypothetical protein
MFFGKTITLLSKLLELQHIPETLPIWGAPLAPFFHFFYFGVLVEQHPIFGELTAKSRGRQNYPVSTTQRPLGSSSPNSA